MANLNHSTSKLFHSLIGPQMLCRMGRSCLMALSFAGALACEAADTPPNVIFILTDDQRWDSLGCSGNADLKTPELDRLASQGIRFSNAFVTTAICNVSRASIFSGQHYRRHGINDFHTPFSAAQWSCLNVWHLFH